jgi:hypothetical protein
MGEVVSQLKEQVEVIDSVIAELMGIPEAKKAVDLLERASDAVDRVIDRLDEDDDSGY